MTQLAFGQVAPVSRRAVAYVIDAAIATGLSIVLGGGLMIAASLTGSLEGTLTTLVIGGPIVALILLGWFVVYTLMQSKNGSIGMRAQGLRLAGADGGPLGFGRALLRNVIFGLAASIVVGYFTPLFDGSGRYQGWHDKVANALMLDARATSSPSAWMTGPAVVPQLPGRASATPAPPAPLQGFSAPAAASVPPAFPSGLATAPAGAAPTAVPPAPAAPQAAPFSAPRPVVPAAPVAEVGALIAFVPGVTQDAQPPRVVPATAPAPAVDVQPEPAYAPPVAQPAAAPAAPAVVSAQESLDEAELEDTRISIPGHRLIFTWDDGTRVSVSRRTIFGRNPAPEDGAALVSVRDETLSLSKTHFEAAAETSGGWILDRHSTNGTTIVREGQRIACPAGQRVPVRLGDAIEIGDRIVTIGGYA